MKTCVPTRRDGLARQADYALYEADVGGADVCGGPIEHNYVPPVVREPQEVVDEIAEGFL